MPGIVYVLLSRRGLVQFGAVAHLHELIDKLTEAPAHYENVGDLDPFVVAAGARSLLRPADESGWIPARVREAIQALQEAKRSPAAVIVPPKAEIAAPAAPAKALRPVRRRAGCDVDVRTIRAGLGMSQPAFASAFGFSLATLRDWEQGRTSPDASARSLLLVIEHRPDVVREALATYGVPAPA